MTRTLLVCPSTGLPVQTRPEWNVTQGDHFQTNVSLVGKRIVYSSPTGSIDASTIDESLAVVGQAARSVDAGTGSTIVIEDLGYLESISLGARRKAARFPADNPLIAAVIFCNVTTQQRIFIKIGQRFTAANLKVRIVNGYADAIETAIEICTDLDLDWGRPLLGRKMRIGARSSSLVPVPVVTDPRWEIRSEGFTSRSVLADGCILHSEISGSIRRSNVPPIERMRLQVLEHTPQRRPFDYIVLDSSRLVGGSPKVRRAYIKSLVKWHRRAPFRMVVIYGANVFMRTAARLAKPFVPFRIKIAKDADQAFAIIREDRLRRSGEIPTTVTADAACQSIDAHIQEVLDFIGGIDWQQEGGQELGRIPEDHPAAVIFQSIAFIKEEIDDLFRDRRRKAVETSALQQALNHKSKMEAIGTLSGGVAHDFNNLLAIIIGNTELALDEATVSNPPRALLADILSAGHRAKGVVDQLLTFSRITGIQKRPVDISETVRNVLKLLRATLPADIGLRLHIDDKLARINADDNQIHQVVLNLATNAADAMAETGGTLSVRLENAVLHRPDTLFDPDLAPGGYVRLTVSDTGSGITQQDLDRVFDPYFTTKAIGKGTGIGLSVVRGIVKSHDGGIRATSRVGSGTAFELYFPVVTTTVAEPAPADPGILPTGSERILLVDDEPALVNIVRIQLERLGYTVRGTNDPLEALDRFEQFPDAVDLVITDTSMPNLTGDRLAKKILGIRPNLPVILLTGYSKRISEAKALELGVCKFLLKPVDAHCLATAVREALDGGGGPAERCESD